MDARIDALLAALTRIDAPSDLASGLRGLPPPGTLPTPWETWTLIGLVRHRERQLWVESVVRTRLRGSPADLAVIGALGHPEGVAQSGSVPGLPEWEYYFHGRGCCLTHKVDGDAIDVDFFGDSAEYFDTYFYTRYLDSLRRPEPAERRLRELHRSLRPVGIAVKDLVASGALSPLPEHESHPRVSDEVLEHADLVEAFCLAWADEGKRVWLAALVGDWLAAHDAAAGQGELEGITGPRAEECRRRRRERLLKVTGHPAADALHGLAEVGTADESLAAAFRGPPSGLVSAALEVAGEQNDPRWCPPIYELFRRVKPSGEIPQPHIWITSLKFLLRHGYRAGEMLAALTEAGGTEVGEAVLLALEHAPERALPLIRKGLLADVPINRTEVAAVLAVIAKPWSIRELLRALEESDDQEKTADARAALLEIGDEAAEKAVLAWEERNPHEKETGSYLEVNGRKVGPFYSFSEHALQGRGDRIRYEMDNLHDRVMKVKNVVPPEPPKPWWQVW